MKREATGLPERTNQTLVIQATEILYTPLLESSYDNSHWLSVCQGLQLSRLMRRAVPLLIQWFGVIAPDLSSTLTTKDARPAMPERTGK